MFGPVYVTALLAIYLNFESETSFFLQHIFEDRFFHLIRLHLFISYVLFRKVDGSFKIM